MLAPNDIKTNAFAAVTHSNITKMKTIAFFLSVFFILGCTHQPSEQKPNVLLILTDDQGYGDVGYHNNPNIKTPTIDSLANTGIRFTNFYVSPRCAPTRAALLTGKYPEKTGVFHVTDGGYNMAEDEVTMAEYFKQAGYKTAICGKWHIGDHYPYMPSDQGFDFSLIHKGGCVGQLADHPDNYWDMTLPREDRYKCYFNTTLFKNREVYKAEGYIADVFTNHAMDFIKENKDHPFFMYLPYNTPHDPFQVPDNYFEMYADLTVQPEMKQLEGFGDLKKAKYVYAMMTNMDDNIQRIVQLLHQLDIAKNTIILFLSDNGPAGFRYTGGLRGHKGEVYEGGIRVPAFINYSGLPGNTDVSVPAAHYDLLPTLAELCGLSVQETDGVSMVPALTENTKSVPYRPLIIRETNYMEPYRDIMIRKDEYKLVARGGVNNPTFELFNLKNDPFEQHDLNEKEPEMLNNLKGEMDAWYKQTISAKNLRILPNVVGTDYENPVRLSRHELVRGYANGWFSRHYVGHYVIDVREEEYYRITLTFRDTIEEPGKVEMKFGPVGRKRMVENVPVNEIVFDRVLLPKGIHNLQTLYQNGTDVISPFYVEIEKK